MWRVLGTLGGLAAPLKAFGKTPVGKEGVAVMVGCLGWMADVAS